MRAYARASVACTCTRVHVYPLPSIYLAVLHIPPHLPRPRGAPYAPSPPPALLFTIFTRRSFIKSGRPRAFSILSMLRSTYRCVVPLSLRLNPDSRARNALSSSIPRVTGSLNFFLRNYWRFDNRYSIIFCRSYGCMFRMQDRSPTCTASCVADLSLWYNITSAASTTVLQPSCCSWLGFLRTERKGKNTYDVEKYFTTAWSVKGREIIRILSATGLIFKKYVLHNLILNVRSQSFFRVVVCKTFSLQRGSRVY